MDENEKEEKCVTGRMVDPETVEGKVEFDEVWFRYPTRPEEYVLRGLSIKIEPGQSVALV
jgi:ATP-binding cassette subfamily B (MDR/TAP) protein 1